MELFLHKLCDAFGHDVNLPSKRNFTKVCIKLKLPTKLIKTFLGSEMKNENKWRHVQTIPNKTLPLHSYYANYG